MMDAVIGLELLEVEEGFHEGEMFDGVLEDEERGGCFVEDRAELF